MAASMTPEEAKSFLWGGVRARPRKKIERAPLTGQTYLKPPGSCQSKWDSVNISIEIQCCENCNIYVLDVTEQVQISDCHNCRIIVGPCKGSVFLMDSTGCTVSTAAKQLRLRDCKDCTLHIFAPTQESAVVETCERIRFGCWNIAYPELAKQFRMASWDASTNFWNRVYDFSPADGDAPKNWSAIDPADNGDGRWCELEIAPSGLNGGAVTETRGAAPAVRGCECPCAAGDGTLYSAEWFDAAAVQTEQIKLEPAAAKKPKPAPVVAPAPAEESGALSRAIGWLRALFGFGKKEAKPAPSAAPAGDQSQLCSIQ